MPLLDEETLAIAHRMSKRYSGARFNHDDAFQSAVLNLIAHPEEIMGRKVLRMRRGVSEGFADVGYATRIPLSTLTKWRKSSPDKILSLTDSIKAELQAETGFWDTALDAAEDRVLVRQVLASLTSDESRVIGFLMRGTRFAHATRGADKELLRVTLEKIRSQME